MFGRIFNKSNSVKELNGIVSHTVEVSKTPKEISPLSYPDLSSKLEQIIDTHAICQTLYVITSLRIPDVIGGEFLTVYEISRRIKLSLRVLELERLLNACTCYGYIIRKYDDDFCEYSLTEAGAILQSNFVDSSKLLHFIQPDLWDCWSCLEMYIRNEISTTPYEYIKGDTGQNSNIVRMYQNYINTIEDKIDVNQIIGELSIGKDTKIIQCGGCAILLNKIRSMLPENALTLFISKHLTQEIEEMRTINELETCDVFICYGILSQHDDNGAQFLIERSHSKVNSTLILIELILPDANKDADLLVHFKYTSDIMKMMYGGKERTESEWRNLLNDKFTILNIISLTNGLSAIVCEIQEEIKL